MSGTAPGFPRIWAWREEQGDVYTGEWTQEGDRNAPIEAVEYISADLIHDHAAIREAALREAAEAIDAAMFDHPSVFMGGPSAQARRSAEYVRKAILSLIDKQADTTAGGAS